MAKGKKQLNIPATPIKVIDSHTLGAASIAVGKVVGKLPGPAQSVAQAVLRPPSVSAAKKIIAEFLASEYVSEPTEPRTEPSLNVPIVSSPNPLPELNTGATLSRTPIYSNLEIEGKSWTNFDGTTGAYEAMYFNTVLISCIQNKNIVETPIQGSDNGAVIEYSGLNNYEVTINIICVGNNVNGYYPTDEVELLIKALTAPVTLKVNSWYLLMFDIQEIVVNHYDIAQAQGSISQQAVTIIGKSVKRPTLVIQQKQQQ